MNDFSIILTILLYIGLSHQPTWYPVGSGVTISSYWVSGFQCLTNDGTNIYGGGQFLDDLVGPYIWDGSNWSVVGGTSIIGDVMNALAVNGSQIFVGGSFSSVGLVNISNLGVFNGSDWSELAIVTSAGNVEILRMVINGNILYVGGSFESIDSVSAYGLASFDGNSWSSVGSTKNGTVVYDIIFDGSGNVYVGGNISISSTSGGLVAKWNISTSEWMAYGTQATFEGEINALGWWNQTILFAGSSIGELAWWNGSSWEFLPSFDGNGAITQMVSIELILYICGSFTTPSNYIEYWNGFSFGSLQTGLQSSTSELMKPAMTNIGDDLYVAGFFSRAGSTSVNNVAYWVMPPTPPTPYPTPGPTPAPTPAPPTPEASNAKSIIPSMFCLLIISLCFYFL